MTDAPERIWAARGLYTAQLDNRWPTPVEYIRADLYDNTALKAAADMMADEHGWVRRDRIEALTAKLDDLQDRLDAANKARAHVMRMAVKKQGKIEALTKERDEHWKSFVHWRKEADALTEQLEAARADAKGAEDYAEELEEKLRARTAERNHANDVTDAAIEEVNRLKALLATCEKYRDAYAECDRIGAQAVRDLEAKLAKAVEALRFYATQDVTFPGIGTVTFAGSDDNGRKARTTLAEIEGEKGCETNSPAPV